MADTSDTAEDDALLWLPIINTFVHLLSGHNGQAGKFLSAKAGGHVCLSKDNLENETFILDFASARDRRMRRPRVRLFTFWHGTAVTLDAAAVRHEPVDTVKEEGVFELRVGAMGAFELRSADRQFDGRFLVGNTDGTVALRATGSISWTVSPATRFSCNSSPLLPTTPAELNKIVYFLSPHDKPQMLSANPDGTMRLVHMEGDCEEFFISPAAPGAIRIWCTRFSTCLVAQPNGTLLHRLSKDVPEVQTVFNGLYDKARNTWVIRSCFGQRFCVAGDNTVKFSAAPIDRWANWKIQASNRSSKDELSSLVNRENRVLMKSDPLVVLPPMGQWSLLQSAKRFERMRRATQVTEEQLVAARRREEHSRSMLDELELAEREAETHERRADEMLQPLYQIRWQEQQDAEKATIREQLKQRARESRRQRELEMAMRRDCDGHLPTQQEQEEVELQQLVQRLHKHEGRLKDFQLGYVRRKSAPSSESASVKSPQRPNSTQP